MKKMILLLMLPLTVLMAIEFVMTRDGLVDAKNFETTTPTQPGDTSPSTPSSYLEPVNLPACDTSNPEVQFINKNSDWDNINSSTKRIFCVSPGDYSSLDSIELTSSGTAKKRRYIILNNGNDTHPGKLNQNELANFALNFDEASYWTVDRASRFNTPSDTNVYRFYPGSTHNVLNRIFTDDIVRSVYVSGDAHNNTIQNSRFQNMSDSGRKGDNPAIILFGNGDPVTIKNTKILNNEIYNCGDGIMTMVWRNSGEKYQIANGEGTIIDSNDIYIDSNVYTNGNGKYTTSGSYAFAENAIDLKFGSLNPSNPMIITNNHMWGYRKSDSTNSYTDDPGYAMVIHYGVGNTIINDNVIFDSVRGIGAGDSQDSDWAMHDSEVQRNVIKDTINPIWISSSNNVLVKDNIIIDSEDAFLKFSGNGSDMLVTNNKGINSPVDISLGANNGGVYSPNSNNYNTIEAAGYTEDKTFTTDKFTNKPKIISFP